MEISMSTLVVIFLILTQSTPDDHDVPAAVVLDVGHNNGVRYEGDSRKLVQILTEETSSAPRPIKGRLDDSAKWMKQTSILVIVNPNSESFRRDEQAFSEKEENHLVDWVKKGGRLLVVADSSHGERGTPICGLLRRFGVAVTGQMAHETVQKNGITFYSKLIFTQANGGIDEFGEKLHSRHAVTSDPIQRIDPGPGGAVVYALIDPSWKALLNIPESETMSMHRIVMPPACAETEQGHPLAVAAVRTVERGRVVVFGCSGVIRQGMTKELERYGMQETNDNEQLIRLVIRWLLLEETTDPNSAP